MSVVKPARPRVGPKITYDVAQHLPLVEPRFEIIDGRLHMVAAPTPYHQIVVQRLEWALGQFVKEHNLGIVLYAPCDLVFSEINVFQPDILYVSTERRAIIGEKYIDGAPDLIVEISSPSTAEKDRTLKQSLYAEFGVREYWIVDLEAKTVKVLSLTKAGYRLGREYVEGDVATSPLLPGLKVAVAELLAPLG